MNLSPIKYADYKTLYKIVVEAEPYSTKAMDIIGFISVMETREGWTVFDDGEIIGCISLSNFIPRLNCVLHTFIRPDYHGKWLNDELCTIVFGHIFNTLDCRRVTGFCIPGESDRAGYALEHIGFIQEGLQRQCALTDNGYRDVKIYGMLKEECRWL